MRIQLYVPTKKVEHYSEGDKFTWTGIQHAIIDITGGITVQTAFGSWRNEAGAIVSEPVFIIETLLVTERDQESTLGNLAADNDYEAKLNGLTSLFAEYAEQLFRGGEESVLTVIDNTPFFLNAKDFQ